MKRCQTAVICATAIVVGVFAFFRMQSSESKAQTQTSSAGYDLAVLRESIGNFFENMSDPSKGANKAAEEFLKNTPLVENEKSVARFADDLKLINQNFGSYVSYEPIGVKTVGADLVVFRYLYKCQNYPVIWYFTYYRPRAKSADASSTSPTWTLIGFRFDTNLDSALLDATFDQRD